MSAIADGTEAGADEESPIRVLRVVARKLGISVALAQGIEGGTALETSENRTSGPARVRSRSSRFPGVRDPHPHAVGTPTFADVARFVALEAGVGEGGAVAVLRLVARALGLSERELAERIEKGS